MRVEQTYIIISQSVSQEKIDNLAFFLNFVFSLSSPSSVATADMACLSLDEVNGSFKRFVYVYFCCFESK